MLRNLARMLVHFQRENLRGYARPSHRDREQPDRSASGNGYGLGRNVARQHCVYGAAQRIQNRGMSPAESEGPASRCSTRDDQVLREGPIGIDSDDLHVLADVRRTDSALQALAACHSISAETKSPSCTPVTSSPTASTAPQNSCPGNEWRMNAPLRPLVPVVNMKVGAAEESDLHLDQQIGAANFGLGDFPYFTARSRSGLYYGRNGWLHGRRNVWRR